MGEALLAATLAKVAPEVSVSSAGIAALVNLPADNMAQELMHERGHDLSRHRARQATSQILLEADLILTMETRHQQKIEDMLPSVRGRVHRLGKWSGFDITDPYQRPRFAFEQALALIEQGVQDWQRKLWN
jgi:protein-tyrosine phosphatase